MQAPLSSQKEEIVTSFHPLIQFHSLVQFHSFQRTIKKSGRVKQLEIFLHFDVSCYIAGGFYIKIVVSF